MNPNAICTENFNHCCAGKQNIVLVGYFRTSGFKLMSDEPEPTEKIRILVGLNVDRLATQTLPLSVKEAKENFSQTVKAEFDNCAVSYEVEYGVKKFLEPFTAKFI